MRAAEEDESRVANNARFFEPRALVEDLSARRPNLSSFQKILKIHPANSLAFRVLKPPEARFARGERAPGVYLLPATRDMQTLN